MENFDLSGLNTEGISELSLLVLLADHSYSVGPFIDQIQNGINRVREKVRTNDNLSSNAQVAVIGYSDDVEIIRNFGDNREVTELAANGCTAYYKAQLKACNLIAKASTIAQRNGIRVKAVIINFTDGGPTDGENEELSKDAIEYLKNKGVFTMALAVPSSNLNILKRDYKNVVMIDNEKNIEEAITAFSYQSLLTLSKSQFGTKTKMFENTKLEMEAESGVKDINEDDDFYDKFSLVD